MQNIIHLEELDIFKQTCRWPNIYFSGNEPDFIPLLFLHGTEFQKMVWEILLIVPYEQTMTYGEIASRINTQKGIKNISA